MCSELLVRFDYSLDVVPHIKHCYKKKWFVIWNNAFFTHEEYTK